MRNVPKSEAIYDLTLYPLQHGQYFGALRETLIAATISLVIAGAYRAADWIMTPDRRR